MICNHPARFGGHRYSGSGDKMFLIYHMAQVTTYSKGCVTDGLKFRIASHHLAKLIGHRSCHSSGTN